MSQRVSDLDLVTALITNPRQQIGIGTSEQAHAKRPPFLQATRSPHDVRRILAKQALTDIAEIRQQQSKTDELLSDNDRRLDRLEKQLPIVNDDYMRRLANIDDKLGLLTERLEGLVRVIAEPSVLGTPTRSRRKRGYERGNDGGEGMVKTEEAFVAGLPAESVRLMDRRGRNTPFGKIV